MAASASEWIDHRSPLPNVAAACQSCHRIPEKEITARVLLGQDRNAVLLSRGEEAVAALPDGLRDEGGGRAFAKA